MIIFISRCIYILIYFFLFLTILSYDHYTDLFYILCFAVVIKHQLNFSIHIFVGICKL